MFRHYKKVIFLLFAILTFSAISSFATLFFSRKQAIRVAFPNATKVESKNVILAVEEQKKIQQLSKVLIESRIFTYYVARKGDKIIGYAFIESHVVRTMPEAVMTVITPDGKIEKVFVLAFYEPLEYLPSELWLNQFINKTFKSEFRLNGDIQGITGATLSSRAIAKGVKRNLAFYKIKIKPKG